MLPEIPEALADILELPTQVERLEKWMSVKPGRFTDIEIFHSDGRPDYECTLFVADDDLPGKILDRPRVVQGKGSTMALAIKSALAHFEED